MNTDKTRRIALMGMLFALAMVLSYVESLITPLLGLPPGVKPGLANIAVMYALFCLGKREAAALAVLKALFVLITRGVVAGALSLSGGLLSLGVLIVLSLPKRPTSFFIRSVCGAIAHNLGQLLALNIILTQSVYTWYYLPVLLLSGLGMGTLTALLLRAVLPALEKLHLKK